MNAGHGTRDNGGKVRRSYSGLVGSVLLTGSDAGNVSSRPLSSLLGISLSAFWACFGSAACLSVGAGSNL